MSEDQKKPTVLIILDGFGHREAPQDNAIHHAKTPFWDQLIAERPNTLISASGLDVGLPEGQFGNSEVGHMSLGAGRVVYQNISRIDKSIRDGDFFENPIYTQAIDKAIAANKAVHVLGLLSPGGVHAHENHIEAMIKLAAQRGAKEVYLHAILDGRDTPPRSAENSLKRLDNTFAELGCGRIASLCGRYYAMDRDNRWDRVEQAYRLFTEAHGEHRTDSATEGLAAAYARNENDEFVAATVVQDSNQPDANISDGDAVIFMNFRADRAREITRAFVDDDFNGFNRQLRPQLAEFVMTTEYAGDIAAPCAYPPESISNSFGEVMEAAGKQQLRIAETEKYAHVTFFFSGGREALYAGEDRILVSSPDVATYDLQPEMSAEEVTDKLVEAIESGQYDSIICNYANGDMVGHSGIFDAAVAAVEALDSALKRVCIALEKTGGHGLITADHGNCEQMLDYIAEQPHTQHTTEHVPFVYFGAKPLTLRAEGGILADVAPTLLDLMDMPQPDEMTGRSLIA